MLNRLFATRYLRGTSSTSVVKILGTISVFGIGLGVLSMIVVLSVMNGFDEEIEKRTLQAQPHLVIQSDNLGDRVKVTQVIPNSKIQAFSKQDIIIRTIDGVFSAAEAYGVEPGQLPARGRRISRAVEVIEKGDGSVRTNVKSTAKNQEIQMGENEIVVGYDLARSLGIFEGDEVTLIVPESLLVAGETPVFQKVKVKALLSTDVQDIDTRSVYYDMNRGLRKFKDTASTSQGFEVRLADPHTASYYKSKLRTAGFQKVKSWEDLNAALFYSLAMEKKFMGIFLAITVLVSSFSIMSVLFLLVTEKQKDVGILKALGATRRQILSIFSSVGFILGALGIGGGTLLGLGVCLYLKKFNFIKLPDFYQDTSIPVKVDPTVIVGIVVLGAVMIILSALWPALKVSKTLPIEGIHRLE